MLFLWSFMCSRLGKKLTRILLNDLIWFISSLMHAFLYLVHFLLQKIMTYFWYIVSISTYQIQTHWFIAKMLFEYWFIRISRSYLNILNHSKLKFSISFMNNFVCKIVVIVIFLIDFDDKLSYLPNPVTTLVSLSDIRGQYSQFFCFGIWHHNFPILSILKILIVLLVLSKLVHLKSKSILYVKTSRITTQKYFIRKRLIFVIVCATTCNNIKIDR